MQSLSDMIQPEDNNYRPPHIKYQTPQGFDLMDIMALPSMVSHMTISTHYANTPRWLGGSRQKRPMLPVFGR